ncbi:hypothetical protein HYC85_006263 [Camellia sinensis]|uniref:Secreted protein n=1 Tax=Camellia sinensis TaxID=4442 RepID=A0A7J7HLV9_CAMSI|nr:hypothetical protein HYC85_006263 [Camellia sinensis]
MKSGFPLAVYCLLWIVLMLMLQMQNRMFPFHSLVSRSSVLAASRWVLLRSKTIRLVPEPTQTHSDHNTCRISILLTTEVGSQFE